jgi:heme O synthase-like polyprenyltransferase
VATKPIGRISPAPEVVPQAQHRRTVQTAGADYWALTKPEINFLIAIATLTGFYLGCAGRSGEFSFLLLIHTLLGTVLVASGTGTESILRAAL